MAWSEEHKANTRQKILNSAANLFLNQGYDAVSIDNVMSAAGLTRGAFYAHFSSKNELYAQAITTAGVKTSEALVSHAQGAQPEESQLLEKIIACYLSTEHCAGENISCPLAFLITDISQRDSVVRETYTQTFKKFVEKIRTQMPPQKHSVNPDLALSNAVMMIGGLALARAVDEPALSKKILQTCQERIAGS